MINKADKLELMLENVMTGCINQLCLCRETAFHRDHFFFYGCKQRQASCCEFLYGCCMIASGAISR